MQIPFWVFFAACTIGKAINKVTIQTFFIIFAFSKHLVGTFQTSLREKAPWAADKLQQAIETQHEVLFTKKDAGEPKEEPLVAKLWNWFIMLVVFAFLYSFVNSIVNNRYKELHQRKNQ